MENQLINEQMLHDGLAIIELEERLEMVHLSMARLSCCCFDSSSSDSASCCTSASMSAISYTNHGAISFG